MVLNHLLALDALPDQVRPALILLLHGGRRAGLPHDLATRVRSIKLTEVVIPELDYDEGLPAKAQPRHLADVVETALRNLGCGADDTLLHVHNHALGKNVSLPGALRELAGRGFGLLLQVHDFAEDFRPTNYRRLLTALSPGDPAGLPGALYPQASHIHFAVLNGRDLSVLRAAGIDTSRLHLLPNPVLPPERLPDRTTARVRLADRFGIDARGRYVLSPVRGIRRKNLGEMLLWAAVSSGTVFACTLPPLNPLEQPCYAKWRALAQELGLPCFFEVGGAAGLSLSENFAACDRVLTTSVAEGFGFVFLEPCLAERPLVGRDLPDMTRDFVAAGLTFSGLQPRIDVPVDWVGAAELLDMLQHSFNGTLQAYGREPLSQRALEVGLEEKLREGCVDFGDLTADVQELVLRKVCGEGAARKLLLLRNPGLRDTLASQDNSLAAEVSRNSDLVRSEYSLEVSGRQLSKVYRSVMESPRTPPRAELVHGDRILNSFLNLRRFHPVRV